MSLIPRFVYGDLDLTDHPFAVEFGSDFGNPENVVEVVESLLLDGEVLDVNRRSNRTLSLTVMLDDADLLAVAEAEALLVAEAEKTMNTLTIDPGDGIGPATVFETFQAQLRWVRDDDEEQAGVRRISMEIPALPFARSADPFIDDADTPPSTGVQQDDCEDATDWSSESPADAPLVDATRFVEGAGSILCEAYSVTEETHFGRDYLLARNRDVRDNLSVATGSGGYLSQWIRMEYPNNVTGKPDSGLVTIRQFTAGDTVGTLVDYAVVETASDKWARYAWPVEAGITVEKLEFYVEQYRATHTARNAFVNYDELLLSTSATTDQQIVKVFTVPGSARGPGSLYISSPDDAVALGQVLVATTPEADVVSGFLPDIRRWAASAPAPTTDTTALHGSYWTASTPDFDVPVSILARAPYTLVALVRTNSDPLTVGVTAQVRIGGVAVGPVSAQEVSVPNTDDEWRMVVIGTLYLPPLPMTDPGDDAVVRIEFTGSAKWCEGFMLPATSDVSIVDCGSDTVSAGGSSSHLWIDSPDTAQPLGGYWRGTEAGREAAISAWPDVKKPARHIFSAGRMVTWLVATNAEGPRVTLQGFPWWFGNAAQ